MSLMIEITPCFCNFQTPISYFQTSISYFQTPISDFVDQGVQTVQSTTLLFSKRLLLNVTGDRNNPLRLQFSNSDIDFQTQLSDFVEHPGGISHQREELTGILYYSMYCPLYFYNSLTWMSPSNNFKLYT